ESPAFGRGCLTNVLAVALEIVDRQFQAVDDLRVLERIALPDSFGIGKALSELGLLSCGDGFEVLDVLTQSDDRAVAVADCFGIPLLELGDVGEKRARASLEGMTLAYRR